jgi:hypothetical protein
MKFFQALVCGEFSEEFQKKSDIKGFYTTRTCEAISKFSAMEVIRTSILHELSNEFEEDVSKFIKIEFEEVNLVHSLGHIVNRGFAFW